MSQLAASDGQPGNWEEPGFFLRRLETVRFQENGWQEPYESRGSRTVLRGGNGSNAISLPDVRHEVACRSCSYDIGIVKEGTTRVTG